MAETLNTVPKRLHHWATHQPDTAAFVFVDCSMRRRVLTRADVYRLAARFAAILRRDDVRRGDVVCNTLPNSPERVVSDFGIMMAGATAMNGQIFLADGADFMGSLNDSQCKAVILDPLQPKGAASLLASLKKEELSDGTIRAPELPALRRIFPSYWESVGEVSSFLDMLEQQQDSYIAEVAADDLACLWTTSGSTDFSKLVPFSHCNLMRMAARFTTSCGMSLVPEFYITRRAEPVKNPLKTKSSPADCSTMKNTTRFRSDVDTNHQSIFKSSKEDVEANREETGTLYAKYVFFNNGRLGWSGAFPSRYLAVGVTRVLLDLSRGSPTDPAGLIWAVVRQERCNFAFMLPYHLHQILSREDLWRNLPWKFSVLTVAGQPVLASLVKSAVAKVTDTIRVNYGCTELGSIASNIVLDPEKYKDCNNGKPVPPVEVKVINDKEKMVSVPNGKMGEIIVWPNKEFRGYVNNEEATKKVILGDGWFYTGDVGYVDNKGDLYVICRSSFTIMRGAYLLHPGWLETRISTHPAVESVLVVPVPDPVLHQELCACVVTKPEASLTAEELREFCQTLFLTDSSDHMTAVPPYFLFFSTLPTNATGKPCRQTTTKEARERLHL